MNRWRSDGEEQGISQIQGEEGFEKIVSRAIQEGNLLNTIPQVT